MISNISKKTNLILFFLFFITAFQTKCQEDFDVELNKYLNAHIKFKARVDVFDIVSLGVDASEIADSKTMFDLSKKLWKYNLKDIRFIDEDHYRLLKNFSSNSIDAHFLKNFELEIDSILSGSNLEYQGMYFIPAIVGFLILSYGNQKFSIAMSSLPDCFKILNEQQINLIKILDACNINSILRYSDLAKILKLKPEELTNILNTFDINALEQFKDVFQLYDDRILYDNDDVEMQTRNCCCLL